MPRSTNRDARVHALGDEVRQLAESGQDVQTRVLYDLATDWEVRRTEETCNVSGNFAGDVHA